MSNAPAPPIAIPRPAATVVLVRDAESGPEVLMLRRPATAAFMPDAWVFPGGALDPADGQVAVLAHFDGPDDAAASARLGVADGGRAWFVAAIRECFEECGLLLAADRAGHRARLPDAGSLLEWRREVLARPAALAQLCARAAIRLAGDQLAYFGHWITPESRPRRFDTRFFVAAAPHDQEPCLSGDELQGLCWIAPRAAIERGAAGELTVMHATRETLQELAAFPDAGSLLAHARARREVRTNRPAGRGIGPR